MEDLNHLMIKYVFKEKRDPIRDLENSIFTLANDLFLLEFSDTDLDEPEELENAIELFVGSIMDVYIDKEPKELQKLLEHPEAKDRIRQKIKEVVE